MADYCSDKKCLRHVCEHHSVNIPITLDYAEILYPFSDCKLRIHMKGDDYEPEREPSVDYSKVDTSGSVGGADSDWPDSTRMDTIGRNGNTGLHYEDDD